MLIRQKRLKKSMFPYSSMKVGDVVVYRVPFGHRDGWLMTDEVKGYQFGIGRLHRLAIRDAEKKLGAEYNLHYGEGYVLVTRIK